ncbi:MAG: hypothetical protein M3Q69_00320 [Acidobacteriota bacterium]|nr:hypothetical protein [Acidobacteriota bacterium]
MRKLTPGAPVAISFAVIVLYVAILFSARNSMLAHLNEFGRRFSAIYAAIFAFIFILIVAAMNGVLNFGFDKWKAPAVSLLTYCVPLIAALLGYAWLQREEMMDRYFLIYSAVTSVALIGTVLEYLRVPLRILGMVGFEGDYIRHLPGIQIRLLSGFYRGPDIMAWHASTLTAIAIAMTLRYGSGKRMLLWGSVAAWGFLNCMISGRRKAIYFVVVFCAAFLWRYVRRLRLSQVIAFVMVLLTLGLVVRRLATDENASAYTHGAKTSERELAQRLEGGAFETFAQFGLMGAGLGSATQGVYHLLDNRPLGENIGWQEGGLGKLAVEVGLPGILALMVIAWVVIRLLLRLTAVPDVHGSSQFLRVTLFAMVTANVAGFIASAQAYTDAVLALTAGFYVGCLFASAALDERVAAAEKRAQELATAEAARRPGGLRPLPSMA